MDIIVKVANLDTANAVAALLRAQQAAAVSNSSPLVVTMFEGVQRDPTGFLIEGRVELRLGNKQVVSARAATLATELETLDALWQDLGLGSHLTTAVQEIARWVEALGARTPVELVCLTGASVQVRTPSSPGTTSERGAVLLALTALEVCSRDVRGYMEPGRELRLVPEGV